jgi:hypothetical protein
MFDENKVDDGINENKVVNLETLDEMWYCHKLIIKKIKIKYYP